MSILLIILAVIVSIGIIRVIIKPFTGIGDLILDLFLLDCLGDILGAIFEGLGDADWD